MGRNTQTGVIVAILLAMNGVAYAAPLSPADRD